jgi:hypothetical protein
MKNLDPETIEKKAKESIKTTDSQELSDEMLDGVSGGFALSFNTDPDDMENAAKGLVQLINPSSSRL